MRRVCLALLALCLALPAFADSTINPNIPPPRGELISADIRSNFAAARSDVNNLLGSFPSQNAPVNPAVGQLWRKTNVSPQIVSQWTGSIWAQVATFDVSGGRVTPYFGNPVLAWQQLLTSGLGTSGQCITSNGPGVAPSAQNCVSGATVSATTPLNWNSGTLTMSLNYGADLALSGSNLVLSSLLSAGGPIGSTSTVPVITYDAKGRLTAVTSATITPAAIGAVPTTRVVTAGTGLSGGCTDLSADCSFALANTAVSPTTYGSSTSIPNFTVDAQGRLTAAAGNPVIAPAGTLTGTTLNPTVVTSSLTSVGALGAGSATTGFTINAGNVTWSGSVPGANLAVVANASGSASATFGVVKCDGTTIVCASGVITAIGGAATSVAIGTTTITGGSTGQILFDNGGVLGEKAVTGSGSVALATNPTFVTPVLGAATATSLNGLTVTSSTGTLTVANGKTLTASNSIALAGTDGTAMTFPAASATITQTVASGQTAMGTSAIASAACASTVTATATGATTNDALTASFAADPTATTGYIPSTNGGLTIFPWITANTVNFKVCNFTPNSITPGAAVNINWRVVR